MLKYRDKGTGRVVEMLEPHEILEAAEEHSEDRAKVGSKRAKRDAEAIAEAGVRAAAHAGRTLRAMDAEMSRWERVVDDEPAEPEPEPAPKAPAPRGRGRGKTPPDTGDGDGE